MQQYNPTTSSGLQTTGKTVYGPTEINNLVTRSGTVLLSFQSIASEKRKLDNGDHVVKKLCFTYFDEFIGNRTVFSPAEANGLVTRSGAVLSPLPSIASKKRKLDNGDQVKKLCFDEFITGRSFPGPSEVNGLVTRSGAVLSPLPSITSHQRKLESIVKKLCFMEVLQQYQAVRRSSTTNKKQIFVGLHTRSGRTVVYGPGEVDGIHTRSGAVVKSPTFKSSKVTI